MATQTFEVIKRSDRDDGYAIIEPIFVGHQIIGLHNVLHSFPYTIAVCVRFLINRIGEELITYPAGKVVIIWVMV